MNHLSVFNHFVELALKELTIFTKNFLWDVSQGSECTSDLYAIFFHNP